jgi:hypothetical protein
MVEGGLRAQLRLGSLRLCLEPGAELLIAKKNGSVSPFLASGGLKVTVGFAPGGSGHKPLLKIQEPSIDPVFPIIYKFYAASAMGKTVVVNSEKSDITDVSVTFFVPSYMDGPRTVAQFASLKPGEKREVPITAILKNTVLGITETDKAQAQIQVKYSLGKESYTIAWDGSINIEGRNGIVWTDDRIAAAFVTAKDPTILKLSRNAVASMPKSGISIPSESLRQAALLYASLEAYGLRYVIDPKGSYATMKGKAEAVDYLQFPVETLAYRTGDCDDLSTLYLAMLESVGIETAFITVPGHIYSAFALDMNAAAAKGILADSGEYIVSGDKVWIPVETTAIGMGFDSARELGARQWKAASQSGSAALIPVHEAWLRYEPSFISSEERSDVVARFPDSSKVAADYASAMAKAADRELGLLVTASSGSPGSKLSLAAKNRIGAIYARYGNYEKAEAAFREAAAMNYVPALCNLGTLSYVKKDYKGAEASFLKVLSMQGTNVDAVIGLARAHYETGRYQDAAKEYSTAQSISPEKASAFAYLASQSEGTSRASDVNRQSAVDWSE